MRYHQAPQNISKQSLGERSSWRWSVFTLIILAPGMSAVCRNCALSVKVKLISETTSPKRRKNRYHCDKQRIWLAFTKQMILKKFCPITAFISCRQLFPKKNVTLSMSDFKGHLFHLSMSTFNSALCSKGCHLNKKLSQNIQLWKLISLPIFIEPIIFLMDALSTPLKMENAKRYLQISI